MLRLRQGAPERHRYGRRRSQVADLYLPAGPGPHPVAVVLHGGFWHAAYGRGLMAKVSADLAAHGMAAWNLEYRRVGGAGGWPATFDDVAAGIDALGVIPLLDLDRVTSIGHSAGGHLAMWAAGRARLPAGAPGASPAVVVSSAVAQAGVLDLAGADRLGVGGRAVSQLLGGRADEVPDRYRLASPLELLPLGVPQLLVHGERDRHVPVEGSERYAEAARAKGDRVDLAVLAGVGHMDLIDPRTPAWRLVLDWLRL